jgi:ribonuclease P protein component
MIPKENRLPAVFFKNLFKKGFIIEKQGFSLKCFKENNTNFRIAVVISKKVSQKAVERNLLKRRFLSLVLEDKNLFLPQYSYIFYIKKDIQSIDRSVLGQQIKETLTFVYEKNSR